MGHDCCRIDDNSMVPNPKSEDGQDVVASVPAMSANKSLDQEISGRTRDKPAKKSHKTNGLTMLEPLECDVCSFEKRFKHYTSSVDFGVSLHKFNRTPFWLADVLFSY
ncbi:hypothetical protein CEXT_73391 [Caerostris extrusa]|uniref:Uncharacterized protein n=1 Tax=Caerostris extrusa TaxID=172846 RepID=A0AAV4XK94_CAEEX|nr:hypothetical protein CEXT_73391 [Caerostris extrusa]